MAWEIIEKATFGGRPASEAWISLPCVGVNKTGLTLNGPFMKTWMDGMSQVVVCIDREKRKVGIKPVPRGSEVPDGFAIQENNNQSKGSTKKIACIAIAKAFPDIAGKRFRAYMDAQDRIIEVDLSPRNFV